MFRSLKFVGLPAVMLGALAGCTPDYSPNTYSATAVQQANKVESGVVVGFRQVDISANGTVGAVTGGAAGGILGSQAGLVGMNPALGAVGGTAIGGLVGTTIEHATGDTTGWEYIVRKTNGDLLSVTQREPTPIPLGQKVLVITGSQARIVPDYSVEIDPPKDTASHKAKADHHQPTESKDVPAATSTTLGGETPSPAPAPAAPAKEAIGPAPASSSPAPASAPSAPPAVSVAAPTPVTATPAPTDAAPATPASPAQPAATPVTVAAPATQAAPSPAAPTPPPPPPAPAIPAAATPSPGPAEGSSPPPVPVTVSEPAKAPSAGTDSVGKPAGDGPTATDTPAPGATPPTSPQ